MDDGCETVYGYGRSFQAAAKAAYGSLPEEGGVEIIDDTGIDLGSRQRYEGMDEVEADTEADEDFGLKVVEVEYRHDPLVDLEQTGGERPYHPIDELDGVDHPNDELSGVRHPLDQLP